MNNYIQTSGEQFSHHLNVVFLKEYEQWGNNSGVVLGRNRNSNHLKLDGSMEHVLNVGPGRSGKTAGPVMCTGYVWNDSAYFFDEHGEIWKNTAIYREQNFGQKIIRFEPFSTNGTSAKWNPLAEIDFHDPDVEKDLDYLTRIILDYPKESGDTFYYDYSSMFLSALILYMVYDLNKISKLISLSDVYKFLNSYVDKKDVLFNKLNDSCNKTVSKKASMLLNLSKKYLTEVYLATVNPLSFYADSINNNIVSSDFKISDLLEQNISLYFVADLYDSRFKRFSRLFHSMLIYKLTKNTNSDTRVLLCLDGLGNLGFNSLQPFYQLYKTLPYFKSYGIKLFITATNYGEFKEIIPENDIYMFLKLFKVFIFYRNRFLNPFHDIEPLLQYFQELETIPFKSDEALVYYPNKAPFVIKKVYYFLYDFLHKK